MRCQYPVSDILLIEGLVHRFPDNFEKLSPPILQLDEVEFYYSRDQWLFSGLDLSADLDSRICIVCVKKDIDQILTSPPQTVDRKQYVDFMLMFAVRLVKMVQGNQPFSNCSWVN